MLEKTVLCRWSRSLALALLLIASVTVRAATDIKVGDTYTTAGLIGRTIQALPACLRYCLLGIEIRVRYTGFTLEVFYVPRVEHYLSSLHVMASDRFPLEPYLEWSKTVGALQKSLLDRLAQVVPPLLGGQPLVESSGGQTRYGNYGHHQSTNFKEVELFGHPVALLPMLLDSTGHYSFTPAYASGGGYGYDGNGGYGDGASSGGSGDSGGGFIGSWTSWASPCFTHPNQCPMGPLFPIGIIRQFYPLTEVINQITSALDSIKGALNFIEMAKTLREIAHNVGNQGYGAGGGVQIDRLLCRNTVRIFYPYYLSGPDALFWRSGFPITDLDHATTLLNPFSTDRIGALGETWGHLYPRHGFLNNDHPGRVAPTLAYRGAHLVADSSVKLRPKFTSDEAKGHWQSLSPVPTPYCTANIADLPTPMDEGGGYAYNIWPRYECPLSDIGVLVMFIPFRYCFG